MLLSSPQQLSAFGVTVQWGGEPPAEQGVHHLGQRNSGLVHGSQEAVDCPIADLDAVDDPLLDRLPEVEPDEDA